MNSKQVHFLVKLKKYCIVGPVKKFQLFQYHTFPICTSVFGSVLSTCTFPYCWVQVCFRSRMIVSLFRAQPICTPRLSSQIVYLAYIISPPWLRCHVATSPRPLTYRNVREQRLFTTCSWTSSPSISSSLSQNHSRFSGTLYTALIWSAKDFALRPDGGYLCYFKFAHSSTQIKPYIYLIFLYLKDVILALSWGAWRKLNACKNTSYTECFVYYCNSLSLPLNSPFRVGPALRTLASIFSILDGALLDWMDYMSLNWFVTDAMFAFLLTKIQNI